MNNSATLPFELLYSNERINQIYNDKVAVQMFGTKTICLVCTPSMKQDIQVSILRHGLGRIIEVWIFKNIPECISNCWVYAADNMLTRITYASELEVAPEIDTVNEIFNTVWDRCMTTVNIFTLKQHTMDCFLTYLFCFTSTTLHILVNNSSDM